MNELTLEQELEVAKAAVEKKKYDLEGAEAHLKWIKKSLAQEAQWEAEDANVAAIAQKFPWIFTTHLGAKPIDPILRAQDDADADDWNWETGAPKVEFLERKLGHSVTEEEALACLEYYKAFNAGERGLERPVFGEKKQSSQEQIDRQKELDFYHNGPSMQGNKSVEVWKNEHAGVAPLIVNVVGWDKKAIYDEQARCPLWWLDGEGEATEDWEEQDGEWTKIGDARPEISAHKLLTVGKIVEIVDKWELNVQINKYPKVPGRIDFTNELVGRVWISDTGHVGLKALGPIRNVNAITYVIPGGYKLREKEVLKLSFYFRKGGEGITRTPDVDYQRKTPRAQEQNTPQVATSGLATQVSFPVPPKGETYVKKEDLDTAVEKAVKEAIEAL